MPGKRARDSSDEKHDIFEDEEDGDEVELGGGNVGVEVCRDGDGNGKMVVVIVNRPSEVNAFESAVGNVR